MEQLRLLSFQSKVITYSMRPPHSIVAPSAWGKIGKTQHVLRRTSLESGGRFFYLSTDKSIRFEMDPAPPPFFFLSKKCTIEKWKGSTRKTWQIWKCTLRVQHSFLPHSFIFLTLAYFILRDSTSPSSFSSITHGSTCHSCFLSIHTTVWPALWWKSTGLSASSAGTSHLYLSCFKSPIERRVPEIGVT